MIIIGRWIYKTSQNAHATGASGLKFSPFWSVGYYFIPYFWCVWPWVSFKQMYLVSKDVSENENGIPGQWWTRSVPPILKWWWINWLLIQVILHGLGFGTKASIILELFLFILCISVALIFIRIVREFPTIGRDGSPLKSGNHIKPIDSYLHKDEISTTPERKEEDAQGMGSRTQGVYSNLPKNVTPRDENTSTETVQERLQKLKQLHDEGLIDGNDYQEKKKDILKDL